MRLHVEPHGRGRSRAWIEDGDGSTIASEVGDLADGRERKRVADSLHDSAPGFDRAEIERQLLAAPLRSIAAEVASPANELPEASSEADLDEAMEILRSADLAEQIETDLSQAGIAGENELKLAVYLVASSRLLPKPLHAIVRGDSSSGKSHVVNVVASLVPPEGVKQATHLSPRALYRMPDLRHRFLVLGERSRSDGPEIEDSTKALREFRSDGRVTATTIVDGKLAEFYVEGPAATIETTTKEELFGEDANRCLLLTANESAEQTERVTAAQAEAADGTARRGAEAIRRRHWAMQRILAESPCAVLVPFAKALQRSLPKERVETRRAFPMLLAVIQASALIHRLQRATAESGEIVADLADYSLARRIVGSVISSAIGDRPTDQLLRFFDSIVETGFRFGDEFTAPDLSRRIGRPKQRVNELLRGLRPFGVIEQIEEARGPHPATWKLLAVSLPTGRDFLPEPEALR